MLYSIMLNSKVAKNHSIKKIELLTSFLKDNDIDICFATKARGNLGFYFKNKIRVSKNIKNPDKIIQTLAHEFAHHINFKLDNNMLINGGSLENLFNISQKNKIKIIQEELLNVTYYVDKNSLFLTLTSHKKLIQEKIISYTKLIEKEYPHFLRSKPFLEFNKYIKNSKAKYLLKYDRVKIISPFWKKTEILSIDNLDSDFKKMPDAFRYYLKLNSLIKKRNRITLKINKLKKYYISPCELFARFIEGLVIDPNYIQDIAPITFEIFISNLLDRYYFNLSQFLNICND